MPDNAGIASIRVEEERRMWCKEHLFVSSFLQNFA